MRAPRLTELLAAILSVAVLVAILFPLIAPMNGGHRPSCLSFLKQQALGLILYADDLDGRLPYRDTWMDATDAYLKNDGLRHCPSVPRGDYGYAFNGRLDRVRLEGLANPTSVPMVYDSANPVRNASDLFASLPSPLRHNERDYVAYADGHAKAVKIP